MIFFQAPGGRVVGENCCSMHSSTAGRGCLRFGPSFTLRSLMRLRADFPCVVVHGSVISVRDTTAAVSCVLL